MPTVKALLEEAAELLQSDSAKLDARLLLQFVTGLTHADIIVDPDRQIADDVADKFRVLTNRRDDGEPVSRIFGQREFHGRPFHVTSAVLDPRADTETLIEAALALPKPKRILDLGTGSGILAITLLAECPEATGVAVDLSFDALAVAEGNAIANGVVRRLQFVHGNWFARVDGTFDLIVSNPPYIPHQDIEGLQREVRDHDPHLALDGGEDGLDPYRVIAATAEKHLNPEAHVLVEIGAGQAGDITKIFAAQGFAGAGQWRDLGGHVRVLAFNMP
jgi:release factor glutamine methyltransferase